MKIFSYDDFLRYSAVSRETYEKLQLYVQLLLKWQQSINLISTHTINDIWKRHIIDSYQIQDRISPSEAVIDVGSGGGFPGLILAIAGKTNITLVESDARKAAFLKEAKRILNLEIEIKNERIEALEISSFDIVTARAFAPVDKILSLLCGKLRSAYSILLLKGKSYKNELETAFGQFQFDYKVYPSITDAEGAILRINNLRKRGADYAAG